MIKLTRGGYFMEKYVPDIYKKSIYDVDYKKLNQMVLNVFYLT